MNCITKRSLFSVPICCLLAFSGCHHSMYKENQAPELLPNILILTADDLGYHSIGAYGCKITDITPNIDKFAAQGVRFTHAHVNTAVCQPCRQSLLTGRYPHNNGGEGFEPINHNVPTLPEQLKRAGYFNGILGKEIHHQPLERFFWDYIPFKTEIDSIWRSSHSRNPTMFYHYSAKFFSMAKEQNRPFFFIANSHDPHRPFVGSASDSATWGNNMPPVTRQFSSQEVETPGYLPDLVAVRKEVAQYYGSVYRCDQSIGAVLDALQESGLENNTLVIFLSDHGASFPFSKAQCYLNSTKTPLFIKWPGTIIPGTVDSTHFISGIDLMPTVMETVGLPMIPKLDGRSFLPLLLNKKQRNRDDAYTTFYQIYAKIRYTMRCIQNEDFGYIYNFWSDGKTRISGDATGGLTWRAMRDAAETDPEIAKRVALFKHRVPEELYNFKEDPDGLINLVNDPAYANDLKILRKRMLKFMKKYHDPAYEAYKDRNNPAAIEKFMESEKAKAKHTKPVERF